MPMDTSTRICWFVSTFHWLSSNFHTPEGHVIDTKRLICSGLIFTFVVVAVFTISKHYISQWDMTILFIIVMKKHTQNKQNKISSWYYTNSFFIWTSQKYLWKFVKDFHHQISISLWNVDFDQFFEDLNVISFYND